MAVSSGQQVNGAGLWRALLQRGLDTGNDLSDLLARKISTAMDPRARMLRQRRRALRWGLVFGVGCVLWASVTALLASWTTPAWVLLITGLIAAGEAIPATLLLLRYHWLRSIPLPASRVRNRRLPQPGSAARPAMSALCASERGLFSLLSVIEGGNMLPADEIRDLTAVANQTAATMASTAAEVESMEQAVKLTPQSRPYLLSTIDAFTAQLGAGVHQYNEMVTAAAQLVASANGDPVPARRYHDELMGATDRLIGWAQAFDELGGLPRVRTG